MSNTELSALLLCTAASFTPGPNATLSTAQVATAGAMSTLQL